jgi:hypothetical protein
LLQQTAIQHEDNTFLFNQNLNHMQTLKRRWLVFSISGLLLLGAGLSMSIHAAMVRSNTISSYQWIVLGTLGLIIFNSGICLFGQAIICKVRLDDK